MNQAPMKDLQKPNKGLSFRILFVLLGVALFILILATLNKTGSLAFLWQTDELSGITHEDSYGYYAFLPNENASGMPVFLIEDGQILFNPPLAVNQDRELRIKEVGNGIYTVLSNGNLFFSSTDHSDANGSSHLYAALSPKIIRTRYILPIGLAVLGLSLIVFILLITAMIRKDKQRVTQLCGHIHKMLETLSLGILLLMILPWDNTLQLTPYAFSGRLILPILQRTPLYLGLCLVCIVILICGEKPSRIKRLLFTLILLLNLYYYFVPEWNYYGVRADTASYIQDYDAESIRTPAYPRFLEDVLTISPDGDLNYWRSSDGKQQLAQIEDQLLRDQDSPSRGLLHAAQAQKAVLFICFLLSVSLLSQFVPFYFVFFFAEITLCFGFLGVYNSYIMTECLSQALVLLCCGLFISFSGNKNLWCYFFCALGAAIAILIRPSNIFLGLLLAIFTIMLFRQKGRAPFRPFFSGLLLFIYFVSIPARNIYQHYGTFIWMPVSGYAEIGHALLLSEEQDVQKLSNEDERSFLQSCMDQITAFAEKKETLDQNDIVWEIALPTAESLGYDQIEASGLFNDVAYRIFLAHPKELVQELQTGLELASERTRIQFSLFSYVMLLGLVIVLALIKPTKLSMSGLLMILLHNIHLAISIINQPERRYIYSTEILFILGAILILASLSVQLSKRVKIS